MNEEIDKDLVNSCTAYLNAVDTLDAARQARDTATKFMIIDGRALNEVIKNQIDAEHSFYAAKRARDAANEVMLIAARAFDEAVKEDKDNG